MIINRERKFCYRITHIKNLSLIIENGIVCKKFSAGSTEYIGIGNKEIIDVRSIIPVKLDGYGVVGDYVPFYFTPRSMMLYNIVTGHREPLVPRVARQDILVIQCSIEQLAKSEKWFFTNGQANDKDTVAHFNDLSSLDQIDWKCIQSGNFTKNQGDYDRPRRYQAEFLVHRNVPLYAIDSLNVFNEEAADYVEDILIRNKIEIVVNIVPHYFFPL